MREQVLTILSLCFILIQGVTLNAQSPEKQDWKKNTPTDLQGTTNAPTAYSFPNSKQYRGIKKQSLYITMRDGIALAIDVYLPKNLKKGEKVPALLHQTRYWRSPNLRFPFKLFSNGLIGRMGDMVKTFVDQGYAIVNVDVRGSGASFGYRSNPWSEDEIQDGVEILDWIIKQDWATDKVGSLGVSYGGTTAEFLAIQNHPSLKAVVLMFSLFDIYDDNAFPGGIHNQWFTYNWGSANTQMDNNELPPNAAKFKWLVKGVAPVKRHKRTLPLAVQSHQNNNNVHEGALLVNNRDDIMGDLNMPLVDVFSPHTYVKQLNATNTAVYSYSGWYDGAYQHAAIKRHINLTRNPHNKLMLGPWEHGGALNVSPSSPSKAGFDHKQELLKFFDFHLKGIDNGFTKEPAVHYFTMMEDKWKSSTVWPPKGNTYTDYFLGKNTLQNQLPKTNGVISHKETNASGMGNMTAWKAVNGKLKTPYAYTEWNSTAKNRLEYTGEVLKETKVFTGHPIAEVYVSLPKQTDGVVFAYLEDVAPDGKATLVTHGQLRILHRKIGKASPLETLVPYHSFLKEDAATLPVGTVASLKFDLLPTSYQFKAGHKIRVSFSGSDKDHFRILHPNGYTLNFHYGPKHPAKIAIPFESPNVD